MLIEEMKIIKRIIALIILYVPVYLKNVGDKLSILLRRYSRLLLLDYFSLLFLHRFNIQYFDLFSFKKNVKILSRKSRSDTLRADRYGHLSLVRSPWVKFCLKIQNIISLGAFRKRLERAVYFTILAMLVEFQNPYSRRSLSQYMERKRALIERLLKKLDRKFPMRPFRVAWHVFEYHSLKQAEVIRQMQKACRQQKEPLVVQQAKEGLASGLFPVLVKEGKSGAYWMRSKERIVLGIFKPFDEEPHAINNPLKNQGFVALGERKMREGVEVGEAAHNEVAAYLIDAYFGFGVVPKTYYASFTHQMFHSFRERGSEMSLKTKYGSFQEFVEGFISVPRLPFEVIENLPLDDYQTILFLDLLIGNSDRHLNNLLFGDERLAAIDHGYCFSDLPSEISLMMWQSLPQGELPFHPEIVKLANRFPFEKISWKLHKRCFRKWQSIWRMRERLMLFKEAVNAALTPKEISALLTRENFIRLLNQKEEQAQQLVADFLPQKDKLARPPWTQRWLMKE